MYQLKDNCRSPAHQPKDKVSHSYSDVQDRGNLTANHNQFPGALPGKEYLVLTKKHILLPGRKHIMAFSPHDPLPNKLFDYVHHIKQTQTCHQIPPASSYPTVQIT